MSYRTPLPARGPIDPAILSTRAYPTTLRLSVRVPHGMFGGLDPLANVLWNNHLALPTFPPPENTS